MLAVVALSLAMQVPVMIGPQTREDSLRQRRRDSLNIVIEESIRRGSRNERRRIPRLAWFRSVDLESFRAPTPNY
jgi:hypothetical protein